MKSQFFKGLSWLIFLNLLVKPVWMFFIDREVQNIVGLEAYGKYFAVLSLSYVLFFLSDAGLSNMLNQRMANDLPVNIGRLFRMKIFLLCTYAVVCLFVAWLTHISQWSILVYVIAAQLLTSLFIFQRSIITANQFFMADAWFSVIDKFLMIVLCGGMIYTSFFGAIDLLLFLQIQTLCTGIAVLLSFLFIAQRHLMAAGTGSVEGIIRSILPFAVCILLMSVHYRLDGFLLERIHLRGALEAGIYASAYRLLDGANMAGYLVASFLVPFLARHIREKKLIEETILDTRHGLLVFSIGVASFSFMFAPWIQQLLYHSAVPYNSLVIRLCIATLPGYALVHIYGSLLTAALKFRQFITILLLSVFLNIGLNIVLIPAYGAEGCCIAALISQYFCGVTCFVVATKQFSISFDIRSMLVYLLTGTLLVGLFYFGMEVVRNVWFILAMAVCLSLFSLATQLSFLKKYFISRR
jgi:O-antigen/teichoic acid export membrane protein